MYTQCPDCLTAFRVTATVLQQAAGRVRCGSCGHSFSALEHLSEEPPPAADDGRGQDGDPLIDTFTDLSAFDDIRIEDTGVEWRVVEDDAADEMPADDDRDGAESGSGRWYLTDEEADAQAGVDDASLPEVRDEVPAGRQSAPDGDGMLVEESGIREPQHSLDLPGGEPAQRRYDDNTPLSDDFDEAAHPASEPPRRRATDHIEPRSPEFDQRQTDLAMGEPDDWRELLDEVAGEQDKAAESAGEDIAPAAATPSDIAPRFDDRQEAELEAELASAYTPDDQPPQAATADDLAEPGHQVPPQTEEEMTINLQIDQDLMRLAAEEGFTSTLTRERKLPEDSLLVETIVMEGDIVKSALDKELDAVVETAAGNEDDPRMLLDTYIKSREHIRGGRRKTDPPGYRIIAGVVVLGIVLAAQVVHAYRETLATYGAFNHTVGSVYRLFGEPLTPQWNVRGWRFEATSGSTDAGDEVLTIRSSIRNESGKGLPYPLLHVALTDRYEEIIGSRILQPFEYLGDAVDSASLLASGSAFTAVITVGALSSDATGFKLNVCYREDRERLRCATEDFRR